MLDTYRRYQVRIYNPRPIDFNDLFIVQAQLIFIISSCRDSLLHRVSARWTLSLSF